MRSRSTPSSSTGAFSSISKVFRKGPPDEDEDLQAAKGELERLEERWAKAASAVNGVGKVRKSECLRQVCASVDSGAWSLTSPTSTTSADFAIAEAESGGKWVSLSTVEPNPDLALAMRSMGRAFESIAGLMQAQVRLS